jgi:hypothetical protein
MEAMQKKIERYNVARLGDIPMEREDSTMWILVCQMWGCATVETRGIKIAATEQLIRKYDVNLCLFMELNYNWSKVNSSTNLASCHRPCYLVGRFNNYKPIGPTARKSVQGHLLYHL